MKEKPKRSTSDPSEFYEQVAAEYDADRFDCTCGTVQNEVEARIITRLVGKKVRILDAGAGTGRLAIALAESSGSVVALDSSRHMLTLARRKAEARQVRDKTSYVQAHIGSLPFKASVFDSVVSMRVLSHYEMPKPIIAEYGRVLRPQGNMVLDASSSLAHVYRRVVPAARIRSAPDYFHSVADLRRLMASEKTQLLALSSYAILPPSLLHRTLCVRFGGRASGALRTLIDTQRGLLAIVEGVRQR